MNLYPQNRTKQLDPALFKNPTAEYRGAPFWSWNNRLNRDQLLRQIDYFKEMGIGGYHIHSRTGLDTPYLGDEFMEIVQACVRKGAAEKMLTWLYDEDRWPSGSAGGLVTKDERHRAKHLLFTCRPYCGDAQRAVIDSLAAGGRAENGVLIGRYEVTLKGGYLTSYRLLREDEEPSPQARAWYAYLETATESPWFNNQTYVDTLSRPAIEAFVRVTHERYAEYLGSEFGKSVPAIFTDEPQFTRKGNFAHAADTRDLAMPFTADFLETFERTYGEPLEDRLPELFWELPGGKVSPTRYRYHDHVSERFAAAFADTIGEWCDRHGIALTGHMMEEPTLRCQTQATGEAMRSYRSFHIPGIDMLCDWFELNTAKQAQSATHQYGRPAMLSELYGVTNWDFDFVGHKAQGDWQAALGVTVRVHHLAWVSMAGEAKRDYPASIFYQSSWYKEYALIEDHFSRVNTVLTRGTPRVRVGVIHPIESYWLLWGPNDQTLAEREERDDHFRILTEWLLFGLIDFDFVCESLLPGQCPRQTGDQLNVGEMRYDAVIVPALRTIRSTTLDRLEAFADGGGTVIFAGEIPLLVDARPSDRAGHLATRCCSIPFTRSAVMKAVAGFREIDVQLKNGAPADSLLHQIRDDGEARHVFFCNTNRIAGHDGARIRFRGQWEPARLDTMSGEQHTLASRIDDGDTVVDWDFEAHGHLLVTLGPRLRTADAPVAPRPRWREQARLDGPVRVTLSEPNALLLDQAEWQVNDGSWQKREEIVRLDNLVRGQLGIPPRKGHIPQPWADGEPAPVVATVRLRFAIACDVPLPDASLAVEDAASVEIRLDDSRVPSQVSGWFVDEAIQMVPLPALEAGIHVLELTVPFSRKTDLEWCYLLGDFAVTLAGRDARIGPAVRQLAFGDWTAQGLPFYTGNVIYHCTLEGTGGQMGIQAAFPAGTIAYPGSDGKPTMLVRWKMPLLSVALDAAPAGRIAFAPFQLDLGQVAGGAHRVDITCFGHRFNAFGSLHNLDHRDLWADAGPSSWRSTGQYWSYQAPAPADGHPFRANDPYGSRVCEFRQLPCQKVIPLMMPES